MLNEAIIPLEYVGLSMACQFDWHNHTTIIIMLANHLGPTYCRNFVEGNLIKESLGSVMMLYKLHQI